MNKLKFVKKGLYGLLAGTLAMLMSACGNDTNLVEEVSTEDSVETDVETIYDSEFYQDEELIEDYSYEDPWICLNDGVIDFTIARSIDSYIDSGYEYRYAKINCVIDEIRQMYPDMPSFTIDFKDESSVTDMRMSGDKLVGFTAVGPNGDNIEFATKNVMLSDSGELIFTPGSELLLLTQIDGLAYVAPYITYAQDDCDWADSFHFESGVSPKKAQSVSSADELIFQSARGTVACEGYSFISCMENYTGFGFFRMTADEYNFDEIRISSLLIRYSGQRHDIGRIVMNTDFYNYIAEGDYYDSRKEKWNLGRGEMDFYMLLETDFEAVASSKHLRTVYGIGNADYKIGDLYDASGNMKSKDEPLAVGDYLMVDIMDTPYKVELPIYSYVNPANLHEDTPAATTPAIGDVNVLVVPYCFEDQQDVLAEDMETITSILGRVVNADGQAVEYTADGNYFTLSDYYEKASYGKLRLTSYVTDWYKFEDMYFEDYRDILLSDYDVYEMQKWVWENYSEWTNSLDGDRDGIFDAVILICASGEESDYFVISSNNGAVSIVEDYTYDMASLSDGTAVSHYVVINTSQLSENGQKTGNTLIHEFGHQLGLIDYYDVTYSGADAVGGFDMQAGSRGDWNPYSKFAAGWTTPIVVKPEDIEDEVIITLDRFTDSGDTLIIPTVNAVYNSDGTLNPFNEYIMVDLFSCDGLNEYDAPLYGLNKTGVRMYHIDARLIGIQIDTLDGNGATVSEYIHNNSYSAEGLYGVEILQKSGNNTFTGAYSYGNRLSNNDLFYEGDYFSLAKHKQFFAGGMMDDRTDFPYVIKVISIDDDTATISISK